MKTVSAKELKNRTGEVLRRVRAGETVVVTLRGVRVAKLVPSLSKRASSARKIMKARREVVKSLAGRFRGLGSVNEFLQEKQREIDLEP